MNDPGVAVVIEDDDDVRNLLSAVLRQSGFEVHAAPTGRDGVRLVREVEPIVVTVDLGLPDIDGYEVLRRVRAFSDCYVVILTSRADELDALMGLQSGADDYLTKPFRPRELRARVAAMMRRPRSGAGGAPLMGGGPTGLVPGSGGPRSARMSTINVLRHNGLVLDHHARTVSVDGAELSLTRSEFDLLHALLLGRGAVRTKADLVKVVRGEAPGASTYISDSDERAIEVHMGNIRRKLCEDPRNPRWFQTVRGVGYRLTPEQP
ncbi:response regulator transcription factor [Arthrobacter crusticola]|uniref:Response regulator transcription factor n=1 Tax=Arthrobacter crusticola TaxID=2547960 RepID=A0A4R5TX09_9MICC|nr:response regulator transcription factor [Arthrobacter crusticola]TDK25711.1 response regulator transcription factor [Arthrobacter crusticola]